MRILLAALLMTLAPLMAAAAEAPPDWAYPEQPPGFKRPPDDGKPKHVAGSTKAFTESDVYNFHNPPDWFPNEHPAQPDIVAHGKENVSACALCHMATGYGHPKSANLAGLPASYIEEQLGAFKNGDRSSMLPGRSVAMIGFAKLMNDNDMKQAGAYFMSVKPFARELVKETTTVPKTYVGEGTGRFVAPGVETEALGQRIIEVAENSDDVKVRNPHSRFIAYVPMGSIAEGEKIATTGSGKTLPCTVCHGADFKGANDIPGLAGRPAIYIYRQLYDIQKGTRHGDSVAPMKAVVAKLSNDDMIALAAFMASRMP